MWVLGIYVVLMVIGDLLDIAVGAAVSKTWNDTIALPVFLACYFGTLWIAWVIAVWIAERWRLYT
jgi:hypothetical protein